MVTTTRFSSDGTKRRAFPFRFVLPIAQLSVCLVLLWPMRAVLLSGVAQSIHAYFGPAPERSPISDQDQTITIISPPSTTVEKQARVDALIRRLDERMMAPKVLDFPVLLTQFPYIVVSPTKQEWVPKGMFIDIWRSLSWPFVGMFFWWLLGRGIEALFAAKQSVVHPRITWPEIAFAGAMFVVGLLVLAMILTGTPDERRDEQLMASIAGGLLWGVLSSGIIAARLLQRRIQREATAARLTH